MRFDLEKMLSLVWKPLILIFFIDMIRLTFLKLKINYLTWSLDYSIILIAFFVLAALSVIHFGKNHLRYTLIASLLVAALNYPLAEVLKFLYIGDSIKIVPYIYLGDILISVILTSVFSLVIFSVAESMHYKFMKQR